MLNRPLVPVAVVFALGILTADLRRVESCEAVFLCIAVCSAALCCAKRAPTTSVIMLLLFIAGFIRTACLISASPDDISRFLERRPPMIIARVIQEPESRGDACFYVVRAEKVLVAGVWCDCTGLVWVRQRSSGEFAPGFGDRLNLRVHLSSPSGARNPGEFSWRYHLARKGIYTQAYVDTPDDISYLRHQDINIAARLIKNARDAIRKSIDRLYPPLHASVVSGMTLGSYAVLPDELQEEFTETGTLHLLAASGFNCAVISAVFSLMLLLVRVPKRMRPPIIITALFLYLALVGAKASIIRATVMAVLGLVGLSARRPTDLINLLFAAVFIILCINPYDLFDLGFQLSFSSAYGIVAVLPPVNKLLRRKLPGKRHPSPARRAGRWLRWHLIDAASATITATLMTAPITAHAFNQLSLISVPANMSVALACTPVLALGLLSPIAEYIPGMDILVSLCGTAASGFVISAVTFFGNVSGNCIYVPSPGTAQVIGYYLSLGAFFRYVSKTASKS